MIRYTRQEAKAAGLSTCYGSVCTKHPDLDGLRYVSGSCVQCAKDNLRKNRAANPERTRAQRKKDYEKAMADPSRAQAKRVRDSKYRSGNRDKRNAYVRVWNAKNSEKVRSYALKVRVNRAEAIRAAGVRYRLENPETRRQSTRAWRQRNKHLVAAYQQRRHAAKLNRTPSWLTEDDFWMIAQAYELAVARAKIFGFAWHVDHIIPLQGKHVSGLHVPSNLQVIPGVENMRKSNKF